MGIVSVAKAVRDQVQAWNSSVEFLITAEAVQFQGTPPKVVWELPQPGGEEFSRILLGPGYSPTNYLDGRKIWTRKVMCNIHCWMPADTPLQGDLEVPDDNEQASVGTIWLVQQVIQAIDNVAKGNYELLKGGWGDRTMANLGFLYVFQVSFLLPVYGLINGQTVATPETGRVTATMTPPGG